MIIRKYRLLVSCASAFYLVALSTLLLGVDAKLMQQPTQELSRQAYAVLKQNCFGCHGAAKISRLDLRTAEGVLAGGENGQVIAPSDPQASRLYQFISHQAKPTMPPGKKLAEA